MPHLLSQVNKRPLIEKYNAYIMKCIVRGEEAKPFEQYGRRTTNSR
jgi:hypothetical protein